MADPLRGRGRGLALLEALKKRQLGSSSDDTSLESTPDGSAAPSVAPSAVSMWSPSSIGISNPSAMGTSSPSAVETSSSSAIGTSSPSAGGTTSPSTADFSSPSFLSSRCSSSMSGASSIGGRGKMAAMLLAKAQQRPGGQPVFTPASDVSPAGPPPQVRGVGRGLKLLQSLQASKAAGDSPSPTSDVQQITEKMAGTTVSKRAYREVKDTPPVTMKGTSGTPVQVTANFIYLNFEENNVYEYEVRYDPEQDHRNLRFKLLGQHSQYFKTKTFDGTTLYVPHKLPEEALNLVSTNQYDDSQVRITIIFRRNRKLSEMIHIYNVIFKCIMKDLQLVRINRDFFNDRAGIQIPQHKLEVWPGYVTAVDEYEGGLMLTLDSTHKVLRTQSVLSFMKEIIESDRASWKKTVTERLAGCSVMTTYNKKMFRVDHIDDTQSPKSTFEKIVDGKPVQVSFIEYYKNNYGIEIKDWNQPLIISRSSKLMPGQEKPTEFMICLIPELCQLTGLTDDQRSNFRLMKDVATYTKITPNQRHAAFKKYIETVMKNETARGRLSGWGLSIAPETINLTARTLPPETLYFGNNVKVPGKPNADWNGEVTRQHVMQVKDILKWIILYTDRDKQVASDFLETVKRCCRPMGMNVAEPQLVRMPNDRTESYVNTLRKLVTNNIQMVVIICPSSRDDRYGAIKKICCADNPVPSQVINARTLMNQNKIRSITQKILLQMNCKLGGTLWNISIPIKSAMVIGIDSHHDATRQKQSVCAFVASFNQTLTHWYSRVVFQRKGQEIIDNLKLCLVESLKHYLSVNGSLPDRIIIYRDGVGDGELKLLQSHEIPQMKVCMSALGEDYKPALTYIVVQKRINTRIFMKTGGGLENPNPGTIVDHGVTRRDWYDFLIVSQKVNQGTVTPTHYVVVHDSSDMTPDQCQRITYKMCHLYYNWPGTVRVPAPCQYAHKLAYLVGTSIHSQPAETLADKLFFL